MPLVPLYTLLCFALLVIFKAWRLPAERGIETVYRFILCVSLLYRIGWVIAHKAKRARFGRFRRGPVGTTATSRRAATLAHLPEGRRQITNRPARRAPVHDRLIIAQTNSEPALQRERRATGCVALCPH